MAAAAAPSAFSAPAKKAPEPTPEELLRRQMLSHVEKIVVVDSLNVDRDAFFRNYRLMPSAGTILSGEEVAQRLSGVRFPSEFEGSPATGFTNEFENYMIWSQEDTTGYLRLAESVRLIDGSWSQPEFTSEVLNFGEETDGDAPVEANAAFPFMADDGQTLYFAADNDQSLGGYDIFVATKDPSDGEFLIPGNLGMPFNSPYDDYMMVLDRQTGVGWWATERNQLEDHLTLYIYALADERVNVDPEDENIEGYATLSGWEQLMDDETRAAAQKLRRQIASIRREESRSPEFTLPMPGGKTYSFFSDFKNVKAASLMQSYMRDLGALEKKKQSLASLREKYSLGDTRLASQIQNLEQQARADEAALASLLSDIYKAEL